MEYETYYDASGYNGDEVKVINFGSFLNDDVAIVFAAWRASRGEHLPWKYLKKWAIET